MRGILRRAHAGGEYQAGVLPQRTGGQLGNRLPLPPDPRPVRTPAERDRPDPVVERRSLVRVLVAAHDCRRPQVLLYLAAVRDGPSPNGVVCPVWLTAIAITTNNVTMPAMTTTRTIHAPTPN